MPGGALIWVAVVLLASAPASSWLALRRDRQPVAWFVFGAILGPVAVALLLLAPPGRCPRCDAQIHGWPVACRTCGWTFRPLPRLPAFGQVAATPGTDRPIDGPADLPAEPGALEPAEVVDVVDTFGASPPQAPVDGARVSPASDPRPDAAPVIVATGVFAGGTVNLEVGARYVLGRDERNLLVLGPVDRSPHQVRITLPMDQVDLLSIEDRVLVAARDRERDRERLNFAFIAAAGLQGRALEDALADVVDTGGVDERP